MNAITALQFVQQMMNMIVSGYCVATRNALQPLPAMKALYRRRDPLLKDVPPVVYKPWPGQFDSEDSASSSSADSVYTQTLWLPYCLSFLKCAHDINTVHAVRYSVQYVQSVLYL